MIELKLRYLTASWCHTGAGEAVPSLSQADDVRPFTAFASLSKDTCSRLNDAVLDLKRCSPLPHRMTLPECRHCRTIALDAYADWGDWRLATEGEGAH